VARDALETVARALGVGLSSLVNLLNPEVIVIGGGVIAAGEMLLEPARREMRARALAPARDAVRVVAAAFGEQAGMIGAALMAREVAR
jgi:glucokinase